MAYNQNFGQNLMSKDNIETYLRYRKEKKCELKL